MKGLKEWQILVSAGLILFVGYATKEYISLCKQDKLFSDRLKDASTTEIKYEIPSDVEQKEKSLIPSSRKSY